jgi:4-hydroxybutyrate dehydrogenase
MALILYLTRIHLGAGACAELPAECSRADIRRPLVVTDAGVVRAGVTAQVTAHLPAAVPVFDATPPNPTEAAVRLAARMYREYRCDGLVAVGGGSSIDLAKGVAIMATHDGELAHYATILGGSERIGATAAPVIAVPTTAGTGSEVARGALLILDDGRKLGFHSWNLVPRAAICDPILARGLPPQLTAATGMDAMAHCIETFLAPTFNPPADGIALDGLARAWAHIERATADGGDTEARLNMTSASVQGALAFQKGLGAVHSLSHALGALKIDGAAHLHHGTLNAILLPAVLRFNSVAPSVVRERKMERIAHAMGQAGADAVPGAIAALLDRLGLPTRLRALGVREAHFEKVVAAALVDHCHKTNPREATAGDYRDLLLAAL